MSVTTFSVHAQPAQEKTADGLQRAIINVRGGNPVYAAGQFPNENSPGGRGTSFTLYEDPAGHKPLCSVSPRTDGALAVTGPAGDALGALRPPARRTRWRPRHEMELPDGTKLVGRGGTVSAWIVYVVLSPLALIYGVASLIGGYGGPDWFLPTRTAWRAEGGLGRAPMKFYGITDKYKVRTTRLDSRVAYAQAVLHYWSS